MGSCAQRARRRSVKPDDSDPATEPAVDSRNDPAGEALEPSCAACDTLLVAVV
jgi:hypothetical protein